MRTNTDKAWLITNPRSGRGRIDRTNVLAVLHAQGWDVQVREKRHGGAATALAQAGARACCRAVVSCAGDGTVSELTRMQARRVTLLSPRQRLD